MHLFCFFFFWNLKINSAQLLRIALFVSQMEQKRSIFQRIGGSVIFTNWTKVYFGWSTVFIDIKSIPSKKKKKKAYSETRLLRTLKGNEKRYVLTKVRSIQNAILLTGRTGSTCSRHNLPRKMLQVRPECRSLLAFRTVKSLFRALWTWKRAGKLKSKVKGWLACSWSEKKNRRKGKKVLLQGKLVRNIQFCATFCTSYPKKNVHVFRLAMFVIDGENVITECTY